jgi:hypothetical protein
MLFSLTDKNSDKRQYLAPNPVPLDIFCLTVIIVVVISISLPLVGETYDDAFITYRYAYNFANGNGFVYNVGDRFLGTTGPLYGLILGILGLPNPDAIPVISGALSGLALCFSAVALYAYGRINGEWLSGLLAALFFVVNPMVRLMLGGEILFQIALIMWAFVLYRLDRTIFAAVLLGIAVLTRADGIVAAGVIGGHFLLTRRRLPWRELLTMGAVIMPFFLVAWWYYGDPLPATLAAKQAQRDSGFWGPFVRDGFEWVKAFTMQGSSQLFPTITAAPNAIRYIYFCAAGLPMIFLLYRFWLLPLAWIALYILGYHLLDVPFYGWYIVPVVYGLMIIAAAGASGVVHIVGRICGRILRHRYDVQVRMILKSAAMLLLAPGIIANVPRPTQFSLQILAPVEQLYVNTARWLQANTPPDASVGYLEIGYLGYYANRTIIDQLGLVNPGVAPHLARGEWSWSYQHYRPDYIIANARFGHLNAFVEEPWFQQEYRPIHEITEPGSDTLVIYQRQVAES